MDPHSTEVEPSELFHILADSVGLGGSIDPTDDYVQQPQTHHPMQNHHPAAVERTAARLREEAAAAEAEAKVMSTIHFSFDAHLMDTHYSLTPGCREVAEGTTCAASVRYPRKAIFVPISPNMFGKKKTKVKYSPSSIHLFD